MGRSRRRRSKRYEQGIWPNIPAVEDCELRDTDGESELARVVIAGELIGMDRAYSYSSAKIQMVGY